MTQIIISVITGLLTLAGVCVTAWASGRKTQTRLETAQAVTDTKIDALTQEVRTHNAYVQRIPVLEVRMTAAEQRLQRFENRPPAC